MFVLSRYARRRSPPARRLEINPKMCPERPLTNRGASRVDDLDRPITAVQLHVNIRDELRKRAADEPDILPPFNMLIHSIDQ